MTSSPLLDPPPALPVLAEEFTSPASRRVLALCYDVRTEAPWAYRDYVDAAAELGALVGYRVVDELAASFGEGSDEVLMLGNATCALALATFLPEAALLSSADAEVLRAPCVLAREVLAGLSASERDVLATLAADSYLDGPVPDPHILAATARDLLALTP